MKRSVDRREPSPLAELVGAAAAASGAAIAENPVLVGSSTAFLVVMFYVSANALWYQPYRHPEPLMETRLVVERASPPAAPAPLPVARPMPRAEPRPDVTHSVPAVHEPAAAPAQPSPVEERTMRVQIALQGLGLYRGEVDGLMGPQTRAAISAYQRTLGLNETGEIDDRLVEALGIGTDRQTTRSLPVEPRAALDPATAPLEQAYAAVPAAAPVPQPRREAATTDVLREARMEAAAQADIVRIQAGLRAFGNEAIEIDGVMGEKTRSAIREFQSLFRLKVTGEPDAALLAKMQEIGLTN